MTNYGWVIWEYLIGMYFAFNLITYFYIIITKKA